MKLHPSDYVQNQARSIGNQMLAGTPQARPGLGDRLVQISTRLHQILSALDDVADTIHGPTPQEAEDKAGDIPRDTLDGRVTDIDSLSRRLEAAAARIQRGL